MVRTTGHRTQHHSSHLPNLHARAPLWWRERPERHFLSCVRRRLGARLVRVRVRVRVRDRVRVRVRIRALRLGLGLGLRLGPG